MIVDDLNALIQKYSWKIQVRTQELIQDIQGVIQRHEQQEPKEQTLLADVQELYKAKHGSIPNNKKNDINRLSSKL